MAKGRSKAITVEVKLTGVRETVAALRQLGPDASKEMRVMSGVLADKMVGWIVANANSLDGQARLLAPTVKKLSDRLPAVQVGGTKILLPGHHNGATPVKAYQVLFGANFGATNNWRFTRSHRGKGEKDYFVWVSIEEHQREIDAEFNAGADRVIRKFSDGGA